ncbi:MAG: FkbM family methyltransferase [bacterium]
MNFFRYFARKCLVAPYRKASNVFINKYARKSYSMEGEDLFLDFLFGGGINGFFVDVGAHHPKWISNTYFFYKKGWRGINIDAMPGSMKLFKKVRAEDINLEIAISDTQGDLTYYGYNKSEYNTFSKEEKEFREKNKEYDYLKLQFTKKIRTYSLAEILDKHVPLNKKIDFFSIDVEGLDLQVLKSNDWEKYKPRVIIVECPGNLKYDDILSNEAYKYLILRGYELIAKTKYNLIFEFKA